MWQEIVIEIVSVIIVVVVYAVVLQWSANKIDKEIENK